jgi:hypothetical protein
MEKYFIAFASTCALLLVAGCGSGDPVAQKVISLEFPIRDQQTNFNLVRTDPEVQEALQIIDRVFIEEGFARDGGSLSPADQAQGIIATYGRYNVTIKERELIVNFVEFGRRRSSPIVVKTCMLLKEKLGNRFGANRVREDTSTHWMGVR